ncbi:MAG: ribonuclease Z [Gemmatimonadetes bacterium]|nr:ribonuclease Z [Gemmatimonadota bacterium]
MSLTLVTVGTGTVAPHPKRSSPANWVERGEVRVLMDCGAGTLHRLAEFGLPWEHVSHLALTHFHPDHFGEAPALLFALKWATHREEPLVVLGPVGTVQLFKRLADAIGKWVTDPGYPLVMLDLHPGEPFPLGADMTLEVHRTPHTQESVALGVRAPEGLLVYTGDTGPSEELGDWATGCALLLAECSLPEAMAIDMHLTPRQAGALAQRAAARRLVLTHFYPPVEQVDIVTEAASVYRGPIVVANDGDRFEVGR